MNETQQAHLRHILEVVNRDLSEKYKKGVEEHGTILNKDFTKEQVLNFALEEAIDMVVYLYTLKELLDERL